MVALLAPRITWMLVIAVGLDLVARTLGIVLPRWTDAPATLVDLEARFSPFLDKLVFLLALLRIVLLLPGLIPGKRKGALVGRLLAIVGLAYLGVEVVALSIDAAFPDHLRSGLIAVVAIAVAALLPGAAKSKRARILLPLLVLLCALPQIWRLLLAFEDAGGESGARAFLRQVIDTTLPIGFLLAGLGAGPWRGPKLEWPGLVAALLVMTLAIFEESSVRSVVGDLSAMWLTTLSPGLHAFLLGAGVFGVVRAFSRRWRQSDGSAVLLLAMTGLRAIPGSQIPVIMAAILMIWSGRDER